jgi:hypothetical protein
MEEGLKVSIYGRSGSGKTTLWSTFPKPALGIICSSAQETKSIHDVKGVDEVTIGASSEIADIIEYQRASNFYKTIVLDHATNLQGLLLSEILGLETIPVQASWGMATLKQYGQRSLQIKTIMRELLSLACHVVIVAQEKSFNVEGDSELLEPYVGSDLSDSIVGWLNPECDYILQTFIRQQTKDITRNLGGQDVTTRELTGKFEYCLRTGPHSVYTTKFRLPKGTDLPNEIVNPTYQKLVKLISGK